MSMVGEARRNFLDGHGYGSTMMTEGRLESD